MTIPGTHKTRTIKLIRPLIADELTSLAGKLASASAIKKTAINGSEIHIHYDFPATTIADIAATIHAVLDKKCFTLRQRFYFFILSYMEENEQDYLTRPAGWHNDSKYIYADYFARQQQNKAVGHKKQWQKYTDK